MNRVLCAEFSVFALIGVLLIYAVFEYFDLTRAYSYLVAFAYGCILYWYIVIKRG